MPKLSIRQTLITGIFSLLIIHPVKAQIDTSISKPKDSIVAVNATFGIQLLNESAASHNANTVAMQYVNRHPYISLQQLVKGSVAGVYVQEPSGEPGTDQNIFIHGIAAPLLSKRELFDQQAVVFLNGIPLTQENPFAYEIQKYDFNRIGTATNLLAAIDPNNIESIEVIKNPLRLAALGPIAANGAIWVVTKNAHSAYREISINSYAGVATAPNVATINAAYINDFRKPFYDKYATPADKLLYPAYLRDSTNVDYYGPSNWTDLYYKQALLTTVDLSLTGGSDRANFRFFGSGTKNANSADATGINRYNASFFINVAPVKWLTVSSMINYNRMERTRNRNVRDRLAEERYLPDLVNPLTPNKTIYGNYLSQFSKAVDNNTSNLIQGYIGITANMPIGLTYNGRIGFDYNESNRDAFWPTTLLEGNNFVSNYFGYNQRLVISNSLSYTLKLPNQQKIVLEAGQNYMADVYKFDYAYAYNGPNDFIKINVVNGDPASSDYLQARGYLPYYYPSRMQSNLASFYGNATYYFDSSLSISGVIRRDGSSKMQPNTRWFTGYACSATYNLKNKLFAESKVFNAISLTASWARIGKLFNDDRYISGPQYRVDLGWTGEPTIGTYSGLPGLSRPYTSGWVGYNIPWQYSDKAEIGLAISTLNNRANINIDAYSRIDKQTLISVPVPLEWGYTGAYQPGMSVANTGVDVMVSGDVIKASSPNGISWNAALNFNYNKNKLKALPNGLTEMITGDTKLKVGEAIDKFWVFSNNGVYNTDADVPVNAATGQPMNFDGVPLKGGDARWQDINGDGKITNDDRTFKGNYLPKITGGFSNSFAYKAFTLNFQMYFVLGRSVLNQYAASRLDFINTEAANNINSVKEITFWENKQDLTNYPVLNPWSNAVPYRLQQNMFVDNASFLKMRSVTLSYDIVKAHALKTTKGFRKFQVYATATNLFTITPFKGDDPELTTYNGVYDGYGLPLSRNIILGFKIDL